MYGPALTSFNKVCRFQPGADELAWPAVIESENLQSEDEGTYAWLPPTDSGARRKHFLVKSNRDEFAFEAGDDAGATPQYGFDFYTPYLDLGKQFAIKLPGFSLNVEGYAKGQPLRYTLKNLKTGDVYLVVVLKLHKEQSEETSA